jgi:hypothetical protein
MEKPKQAKTLREAYEVLDPIRPLYGEWMEFYVDRPEESSMMGLQEELGLDPSDDDKTLLTGTHGSGKTTELYRLAAQFSRDHFIVFMDASESLNLGDIQYTDLLVLMGLQVFKVAREAGLRADDQKASHLRFWYEEYVVEKGTANLEVEVGAELNAVIARISGQVKSDAPRRQSVRATAQARLSDLLERLNDLLQELRRKAGKRILVIIDGLDKVYNLKQVQDLFLQGANALLEPACRILYTVPFALSYTVDFQQVRLSFTRFYPLPNVKTQQANGEPYAPGREMLQKVIYRRVHPSLLEPEAVNQLVEYSAGLTRELIALARNSVIIARRRRGDQGPVRKEDVEEAAQRVRNTFRAMLMEEHYRELARILRGEPFVNSPVAWELIHNLSLLAYNGEKAWWGIHPIVRSLVEEWVNRYGD